MAAADLRTVDDLVLAEKGVGTSHAPVYPKGVVTPGWREVEWRNFGNEAEGRFHGGIWLGEPGTAAIEAMPFDEFCVLRRGSVRFEDSQGGSREFTAGDCFFVPRGFDGRWTLLEPVEMAYVALGPF
jgi:uncharacterized cupin superfamily protein